MTSHRPLASAALLSVFLCPLLTSDVRAAEETADPYDVLYDVVMTRRGADGKSYARDETAPAIYAKSEFPFDDATFPKLKAALDAFAALPREKIEAYSEIRRALLQRHLWKVFDMSIPFTWKEFDRTTGERQTVTRRPNHSDRREALEPTIASLIRRLALTRKQILALPDPLAATVKSREFAERHDAKDPFKPFLPPGLCEQDTAWICIGDTKRPISAKIHTNRFQARSAFYSFIRLPEGRNAGLEYLDALKRKKQVFPIGTQFALVEQAFLISDQGELILSPLVVGVQLRAFLDVARSDSDAQPQSTQCVAEFVIQPSRLMQGDAVMKAIGPDERRWVPGDTILVDGGIYDPFEEDQEAPYITTRLKQCMECHGSAGLRSVQTDSFRLSRRRFLTEGSIEVISRATLDQKRKDNSWNVLRSLWKADSKKEGTQSSARPDQRQRLLAGNQEATARAAEKTTDPYDVLYDVLMTRRAKNGKSYGKNETGPVILNLSEFPFDDGTFDRLNAALDAFAAIPQERIEAYSDIKRALMQRHLWKVFDAADPIFWKHSRTGEVKWRSHKERRVAVQPKIASLIRRLALSREEILALPDTRAATAKSGGFAERYDPKKPFKPFLPADLYAKESSWTCMGQTGGPISAEVHSQKAKWRSTFLSFIRLPGGRPETLEYLEKIKKRSELFPVGTQFALIEQVFLISDEGELILSPLVFSIQLRAYLDLEGDAKGGRSPVTQCVAEFVIQPRQLMRGNPVMKALEPDDYRFEAGDAVGQMGSEKDPFETGKTRPANRDHSTRLNLCMRCHGRPPATGRSVRTVHYEFNGVDRSDLTEGSPKAISKATAAEKRTHRTWKKLQELWLADSKKKGIGRAAEKRIPVAEFVKSSDGGSQPPEVLATSATNDKMSAFDELYDVLMVRKARNGVVYGENETGPMMFGFSRFPFDNATYPKLTKALAALTGEEIRKCSNVQRAMLQRQLWALFDATIPGLAVEVLPDDSRRLAVQQQTARLIRQLALTRSEIEALPDTMATTVKAGKYPNGYDLDRPTEPFLPRDLMDDSSAWLCFSRSSTPVNEHARESRWRSSFMQLLRLPAGREATIASIDRLQLIRSSGKRRATLEAIDRLDEQKVIPVGTQVALIERAFLISDKGEIVPSPITAGIQLRAYRNAEQGHLDGDNPTQCVAEFISRPRAYMQGKALMAAMSPADYRINTFSSKQDVLELVHDPKASLQRRLSQCRECHGRSGIASFGDVALGDLKSFKRRSQEEVIQATAKAKRDDKSWKILRELWLEDTKGKRPSARPDQPQSRRPDQAQRRSGSTDAPSKHALPELRRSAPRSGLPIAQVSLEAWGTRSLVEQGHNLQTSLEILFQRISIRPSSNGARRSFPSCAFLGAAWRLCPNLSYDTPMQIRRGNPCAHSQFSQVS